MVESGWLGILQIIGALALFIYGIKVMSEGVQRIASLPLREALGKVTQSKFSTFLTGFFTTAALQSSSATTLLTVSFVNAGIISLTAAAGIIIGANVGSTVTIWVVTIFGFEYNLFALCLPMIAMAMPFVFIQNGKNRHWAETVIGFAIVLIALQFLKSVVPDLQRHQEVISFISKDGNIDLGVYTIISACGTKQYYPKRIFQWRYEPAEHTNSKFKYYWRINTAVYLKDLIQKVRPILCLLHPEDGKFIDSQNITTGSIVNGTSYIVKFGQIMYMGLPYFDGETFTGGASTTFTGTGKVYLASQARAYRETDPYPASGDMIRMIELEILTKELGIEREALVDVRNDSKDDAQKTTQ